ncbi:MAG: HAMP domain-containing histidine kinase [Anaerolineae bacterium]|nr:HAMP domain-containing histidine kinase [Anaerolineae bacterium]
MTEIPRSRWGFALGWIAFSALLIALLIDAQTDNPIVYVRIDLASLTLCTGLVILSAVALIWRYKRGSEKQLQIETLRIQAQASDERRRFLRRLDHELKNPLTAIHAGLANLADSGSPETRSEALNSVKAQTVRISHLTADLRKLAQLEIGELEREPVDLNEILEEVFMVAEEDPRAADRRLNLSIPKAPWPLPKINGDRDLLFLATFNLLDNAIKYTRPGDTIELRAFESGTMVTIEIADTGPGISEDELPYVWDELYRGHATRGVEGSGLGLTLVRAIIERHGGQTTIRSRAGQGTVVVVRVPIG